MGEDEGVWLDDLPEPRFRSLQLLDAVGPLWYMQPRETQLQQLAAQVAVIIRRIQHAQPKAWHGFIIGSNTSPHHKWPFMMGDGRGELLLKMMQHLPKDELQLGEAAWACAIVFLKPSTPLSRGLPTPLYVAVKNNSSYKLTDIPREEQHAAMGAKGNTHADLLEFLQPALKMVEAENTWLQEGHHILLWLRAQGVPVPLGDATQEPLRPPPCNIADIPQSLPEDAREALGDWHGILDGYEHHWKFLPLDLRPLLAPFAWRREKPSPFSCCSLLADDCVPCFPWLLAWRMTHSDKNRGLYRLMFPHTQDDWSWLTPDARRAIVQYACCRKPEPAPIPPLPLCHWTDREWELVQPEAFFEKMRSRDIPPGCFVPTHVAAKLIRKEGLPMLRIIRVVQPLSTPMVMAAAAFTASKWRQDVTKALKEDQWPPLVLAAYAQARGNRASWLERQSAVSKNATREPDSQSDPGREAFLAAWNGSEEARVTAKHHLLQLLNGEDGLASPVRLLEENPWFVDVAAWSGPIWDTRLIWMHACGHFWHPPPCEACLKERELHLMARDWEDYSSGIDSDSDSSSDFPLGNDKSDSDSDASSDSKNADTVAAADEKVGDTKEEEKDNPNDFEACGCRSSRITPSIRVPQDQGAVSGVQGPPLPIEVHSMVMQNWSKWDDLIPLHLEAALLPRACATVLHDAQYCDSYDDIVKMRQLLPQWIQQHPIFMAFSP